MTAPYKIGDIVKPKPNYNYKATVCGQCCKGKTEKSWIYHLFNTAEIIFIHENGNVDIDTCQNRLTLYDVPPEMLEKA